MWIRSYIHYRSIFIDVGRSNLKRRSSCQHRNRSHSSHQWIARQMNDPYVKLARDMNYRARSAFKLLEIDEKYKLLQPGHVVVECGCAPGAWTQVVVQRVNSDGGVKGKPKGQVVGLDLLPCAPLNGANFLYDCDVTKSYDRILAALQPNEGNPLEFPANDPNPNNELSLIDVLLSDMAPNSSGIQSLDHSRIITLAEHALRLGITLGRPGSSFLVKLWNGGSLKEFEQRLKEFYKIVKIVKPKSSREDSAEIYLLGKGLLLKKKDL